MARPRRFRTSLVSLLALVALLVACGPSGAAPGSPINASELQARVATGSAPVILDVRTPEEFASGHIRGAVNVPVDELSKRLAELKLSPGEEIVVHCERGPRAAKAESILIESGYTNVRDLSGHMQGWRAESLPLE